MDAVNRCALDDLFNMRHDHELGHANVNPNADTNANTNASSSSSVTFTEPVDSNGLTRTNGPSSSSSMASRVEIRMSVMEVCIRGRKFSKIFNLLDLRSTFTTNFHIVRIAEFKQCPLKLQIDL